MNKKVLGVGAVVIIWLVIFSVIGYIMVLSPVDIENTYMRISPLNSSEQFEEIKDYVNRNLNKEIELMCDSNKAFPSDDYEDYCRVLINFSAKNLSPIDVQFGDNCTITIEDSGLLIYIRPIVVSTNLNSFERRMSDDCFDFFCYRGDLTDEDLIEKFRSATIKVDYKTDLIDSLSCKMPLSELQFLKSFEEFDKIRKETN